MSTPPSSLGPYPVERELGRGGMGVVYLGRDPKLGRPVAIKVLPDLVASSPEALARFDREAKLLASLNHPNIATIYGVEEAPSTGSGQAQRLLVLEYIPGDTLAVRTARGPLPLDEALDVCSQIARAIEAAHEGGVIHRDLKPGNVKITPDGQVKVLDFGLAKGTTVSDAELAHSPTMTFAATGMGVILGTAGYMSPEQARGKGVDRRTDVWSFGCVLFECLAGKQIFEGETVSDTIAKILEREPDWTTLPANTPPQVREILRRCLEKDLKKRQRDIGDVRIQLEESIAARASSSRMPTHVAPVVTQPARSMKTMALAALLVVAGAVAGAGLWKAFGSGSGSNAAVITGAAHLSVDIPPSLLAYTYTNVTPDGQTLIIAASPRKTDGTIIPEVRLYSRRINDYELKLIPHTERTMSFVQSFDGASLAIVRRVTEQSTQRELVKVSVDGSAPPVKIVNYDDTWNTLTWLEDGDFLASDTTGKKYVRVPKNGSAPGAPVTFDLGGSARFAVLGRPLPNGRGVLVGVETNSADGWSRDAWVLELKSNKMHRLFENAGDAAYSQTGHILFSRGETLMAAPFDLDTLSVTGEVSAISRGLRVTDSWSHGVFALARNGTLVFPAGGSLGADRQLVTVDATGTIASFSAERRGYEQAPRLSLDGRRAAVVLANERSNWEIWTSERDRPDFRRTIAVPGADIGRPLWSPDGRWLAYSRSAQDKDDGVYVREVDGTGPGLLVLRSDEPGTNAQATSWGKDALMVTKSEKGKALMIVVPMSSGSVSGAPRPLRVTSYSDGNAHLSADGRLVAFQSNESGKLEVYVATYGANGELGRPFMASNGGSTGIGFTADSRKLIYGTPEGRMMSVTIESNPGLRVSAPAASFDIRKMYLSGWDILPDGRLFAIQASAAEEEMTAFSVVLNWFDELRARMTRR